MKNIWIVLTAALIGHLVAHSLLADTFLVPRDQPNIQAGIAIAQPGDTVLVAEGLYYENLDFQGKDIVVCSEYALDLDVDHIINTIIDGSASADPDTGSCVVFTSGETRAAVLQGFTLTGGTGTSYLFDPAWPTYREGGAVMVSYSDPTICNNRITGNSAPAGGGALPGGGGGISAMYANPLIRNNVIFENTASYAAGMVLNYSAGEVRNNIIFGNTGGGQFGTAGLMIWKSPAYSAFVENNTIVGNVSETEVGGISVSETAAFIRNNIIWGNRQESGPQVVGHEASVFEYCFTEEYYAGQGNQHLPPQFMDSGLILSPQSPCIDAGSPSVDYFDPDDPDNSGAALFPARGALRNDVGAYGGPFAMELPTAGLEGDFELLTTSLDFGAVDIGQGINLPIIFKSFSGVRIRVLGIDVEYQTGDGLSPDQTPPWDVSPLAVASFDLTWLPSTPGPLSGRLAIHHDCVEIAENPVLVPFNGFANQVIGVEDSPVQPFTLDNYPNPFNPRTTIRFSLPADDHVSLIVFDPQGRCIRDLIDREMAAGAHSIVWDGRDLSGNALPSGIYFYHLRTPDADLRRSMVLLK
ncbi:MAG: hypothetical protein GY835_14195 [bacterium]|nr:hypothetical protein [bacterium]